MDITVAIPTYNGEKRLPQVLDRLKQQQGTEGISWEVLVVDNNSTDGTAQVVQTYQAEWLPSVPLRYCLEKEQGAAFARLRAVKEAQGTWVGFLDDDNLPDENWLVKAYEFGQAHPQAGAYGSQIHAEYEIEPPPDFKRLAIFLAIIERGNKPFIYEPKKKMLPPSAGLVVRKQAWSESVPTRPYLTGPTTRSKIASEDIEAIAHIQKAGWEIWYSPEMHVYHQIPRWRLERDYLVALIRGMGLARHHIRMIRIPLWQRPLMFPLFLANDLRMLTLHVLKHYSELQTDLAVACQTEYLRSTLISPFYLWIRDARAAFAKPAQSSK